MSQNGSTLQRITKALPLWLVALVFVLLCAVAVRAPSIAMPFFADDYVFLEQVRNRSFLAAISAPDQLGHYGRPIGRQAFFWLITQLCGESPLAFHLANCLLFLASLTLLFTLVRRKIGDAPALIAITFLAFHYAVDPLLQWASGSQDLLALLFSLVAIHLYGRNRRWIAAAALALALLSKEVAVATVFIAPAASRPPPNLATGVRRSLPLLAVTAAWILWRYLHGDHPPLHVLWIIPGLIHALQVTTGLEAGQGRPPTTLWWVMTALVVVSASVVVWLTKTPSVTRQAQTTPTESDSTWPLRVGAIWALAGTLAILPALDVWSAYYYVFALCGVALVFAGVVSRLRGGLRTAAIVLVIALPSLPRYRESFATPRSPWTWQSHVNSAYLARGTALVARYLAQLRDMHPHLPPKSTLFFSNVPTASGWQSGDGALVRWAYRDSSLRSYFLSDFTRRLAERGPLFVLSFQGDELQDWSEAPLLLPGVAYALLRDDRPRGATDALDLALRTPPPDPRFRYWRAWTRWASGDTALAIADLTAIGMHPDRASPIRASQGGEPSSTAELVERRNAASLDPGVHVALANRWLSSAGDRQDGVIEAYAAYLLDPRSLIVSVVWARARSIETTERDSAGYIE